jgi:hypothetical protein
MLGSLESRLTAEIAEALEGRPAVLVVTAPLPLAAPAAGERSVRVSLEEMLPDSHFEAERTGFAGASPSVQTRRVVQLGFLARVHAIACPQAQSAAEINHSRQLLLEDLSLVVHALDAPSYRDGHDLAGSAPDPGYEVTEFHLSKGGIRPDLIENCLVGELEYEGKARIWPPGVSEEAGEIRVVDSVVEALPIELRATQPVVRAGGQTVVRVRVLSPLRRMNGNATAAMRLAATVLGDLPPAERGTISSGTPAPDTAFRLHAVGDAPVEIAYAAPPGKVTRPRIEFVAVHLAAPDGAPGVFLGSTPIRIVPGV